MALLLCLLAVWAAGPRPYASAQAEALFGGAGALQYGVTARAGVALRSSPSPQAMSVRVIERKGTALCLRGEGEGADGARWIAAEVDGDIGFLPESAVERVTPQALMAAGQALPASSGWDPRDALTDEESLRWAWEILSPGGDGEDVLRADAWALEEPTVWIPTNGGTRYHATSGCSGMVDPREAPLSEAERMGFVACRKCR